MSIPHWAEEEETLVHQHYVILDTEPFILCLLTLLVASVEDYCVELCLTLAHN